MGFGLSIPDHCLSIYFARVLWIALLFLLGSTAVCDSISVYMEPFSQRERKRTEVL